jgi:hypothetical protein
MIPFVTLELDYFRYPSHRLSRRPSTGISSPRVSFPLSLHITGSVFCFRRIFFTGISFRGQGQQYGAGLVGHTGLFISLIFQTHLLCGRKNRTPQPNLYYTHQLGWPTCVVSALSFYQTRINLILIFFWLFLRLYSTSDTLFDILLCLLTFVLLLFLFVYVLAWSVASPALVCTL